ncbi:alpha/beta fold hydrolase [Candidatus Pacearchaeota archaeon]|nr:alpha/beta fold hydrolase [Candidatus Pacearchaeota archaeon]
MISKVVLIHGKSATPNDKWYPWFVDEVKKRKIEVFAPELPNPKNPEINEWLKEIDNTSPDENTVLVGHSRGGVAILRWLEKLPKERKVKKVILIGTNSGSLEKRDNDGNGFYTKRGYDFEKIILHCSDFVVIHSKDDHIVPFSNGEENAKGLKANFKIYNNKKHFGIKESPKIPELLDMVFNNK